MSAIKHYDEVQFELRALREVQSRVREFSKFGDNNLEAVKAQIEALEDRLDEQDAYDKEDEGEWTKAQADSARDAIAWRDGEDRDEENTPAETWLHLCSPRA